MSSATPRKGDRVRISDEGTVTHVRQVDGGTRTRLTVRRDDESTTFFTLSDRMKEKIEVIEQPLVTGGIYMDNDGDVFRYNGPGKPDEAWTEFSKNYDGGEETWGHAYPSPPMRRLDAAK